jgi:hypothetical protein
MPNHMLTLEVNKSKDQFALPIGATILFDLDQVLRMPRRPELLSLQIFVSSISLQWAIELNWILALVREEANKPLKQTVAR